MSSAAYSPYAMPGPYPPNASSLGPRLRVSAVNAAIGWMVFGAGALLVLMWLVLGGLMLADQIRRDAPDPWIGPVVMAVVFVPLGLVFMAKGYAGRVLRFELHENGFSYIDKSGTISALWAEVDAVFWEHLSHHGKLAPGVSIKIRETATLTLMARGRPTVVIDERFPDHIEIGTDARRLAARAMLPTVEALLSAGHPVAFGQAVVSNAGLQLPRGWFPWEAIGSVRWESHGPRTWFAAYGVDGGSLDSIDASATPNQLVLCALLARIGKLGTATEERSFGERMFEAARELLGR